MIGMMSHRSKLMPGMTIALLGTHIREVVEDNQTTLQVRFKGEDGVEREVAAVVVLQNFADSTSNYLAPPDWHEAPKVLEIEPWRGGRPQQGRSMKRRGCTPKPYRSKCGALYRG